MHHSHRLQAYRLATGIRSGYYEDALLAAESDVERHGCASLRTQVEHQTGMNGMIPLYLRFVGEIRHLRACVVGEACLCLYEVETRQLAAPLHYLADAWAHHVGDGSQYYRYLAAFIHLEFAQTVARLHHLRRLDEYGLSRGTLIMDNTVNAALHH